MKAIIGGVISAVVVITLLILLIMSAAHVPQGHEGVIWSRTSGTQQKTLGQGWHLIGPLDRLTAYPVSQETVEVPKFSVQTKDGKPVDLTLKYNYHNDSKELPKIYDMFRGQDPNSIETGFLETHLQNAVLDTFSNYSILEVFQNQGQIRADIYNKFRKDVGADGFVIDSVTMGSPQPDSQTQAAIQRVVDAQQKLEKASIDLKQIKIEAQQRVEKAQGQAKAIEIEAQARAKANEILNKSLNKNLLQYNSIEKWDGHTPQVTGGSTPFVNLNK